MSVCENTDTDGAQDVYQYRDERDGRHVGNFEVTHPVWDADELSFKEGHGGAGP